MKQSEIPPCAPLLRAAMPMLLVLSLTACATSSPPPVAVCPANPQPPALSEPMPAQTYSLSAQQLIKGWRKLLTGSTPTD